uniref:Uncharacterized protein n=1 Tax=Arion vulgaris TaxID=1028688 RepID=A0A0B7A805_9EUPU
MSAPLEHQSRSCKTVPVRLSLSEQLRVEIWLTETTLQNKLSGTSEDIKRAALFMTHIRVDA